jgi:S-formylglutathione hydrolase FrmB
MTAKVRGALLACVFALLAVGPAAAQDAGKIERIKVLGPSLQGNLEGDDPNRDVLVYLPPSYSKETARRYPVAYYLHGYLARAETYVGMLGVPGSVDRAIAAGSREMIIVFPDANTVYGGSMFSNSPTTGDWEQYIARDLVSYIDKNYRTLAVRESRGLTGHSMGGYGTLRIGMKHPDVFGVLYAASSCCLLNQAPGAGPAPAAARGASPGGAAPANAAPPAGAAGPPGPPGRGRGGAAGPGGGGMANAPKAQAAAWAPNPANAPDFFDLPATAGDRQAIVAARWLANSPVVMVSQHVSELKRYDGAIMVDVGDKDPLGAATTPLVGELTRLGVKHTFEVYEGDHMNRISQRFVEKVLPYLSGKLK